MKYIIPVDVTVQRTYRAYIEAEETATNEEIVALVKNEVESNPDYELYLPQDDEEFYPVRFIAIEDIERDGMWSEEEDESMRNVLNEVYGGTD